MTHPDVDQLQHRIDLATRAAARIRRHAPDLWVLGWEEPNTRDPLEERVSGDGDNPKHDRSPKPGHPAARRLFDQIALNVAQIAAELVGYERAMTRLFYAGSSPAETTRGVLISGAEHAELLARQQARAAAGEYTPARLGDQPRNDLGGRP